ncbi:MAG: hypothetical protein ABSG07_12240 [Terriglobales bacterium]|jgi:hypothetical protein
MRGNPAARVAKMMAFALLFVVLFALFGYFVMRLWNWLMPAIFGLHVIGYWQAIGIMVLSKILFGGFHGRRGGYGGQRLWRRRWMERWERMTPEEREKFRQSMRGRCGPFESPAAEPKS